MRSFRSRRSPGFLLFWLLVGLLPACQSARGTFSFQPVTVWTLDVAPPLATALPGAPPALLRRAARAGSEARRPPVRKQQVAKHLSSVFWPVMSHLPPPPSVRPAGLPPGPEKTPALVKGGGLLLLGALLVVVGGSVLALHLANGWGLLTGIVSAAVGIIGGIGGLFAVLARDDTPRSRLTVLTVLGAAVGLGSMGLGAYLGGLGGWGVALLGLGVGSLLAGLGVLNGISSAKPSTAPPVTH